MAQFVASTREDITGLPLRTRVIGLSARDELIEQLTALTRTMPASLLESAINLPLPSIRWDPHNLPPLLWEDLYAAHLAPTTIGVSARLTTLRRFAVIYLFRIATGATWAQATNHFRDLAVGNPNVARAALYALSKGRGRYSKSGFAAGINQLAARLNNENRIRTYPKMRSAATQRFSEPIPAAVYRQATPSNCSHLTTETRLRYAALWIWSDLCSDHPVNAPQAVRPHDGTDHERFLDWQRRAPSGLLQNLRDWGTGAVHQAPQRRSEIGLWRQEKGRRSQGSRENGSSERPGRR